MHALCLHDVHLRQHIISASARFVLHSFSVSCWSQHSLLFSPSILPSTSGPCIPPHTHSHTLTHTHNSSSSSRSTSLAAVAEVCGRSTALAVAEVCGRRGTVVLDGPKNDATAAGMLAAIPAMRSMLVGVDVGWMCGWQVGCRVAGWMCGCPG